MSSSSRTSRVITSRIASPAGVHGEHRPGTRIGGMPVDLAHHGPNDAAALVGELVRVGETALDSSAHLVEALGTQERTRGEELPVMLTDDVLGRPGLARRRALV